MPLRIFDEAAICPKCGGDDVLTRYKGPIEDDPCWYDRSYRPVGKWPKHEYQHRSCKRCNYEWPELVMVSPDP